MRRRFLTPGTAAVAMTIVVAVASPTWLNWIGWWSYAALMAMCGSFALTADILRNRAEKERALIDEDLKR